MRLIGRWERVRPVGAGGVGPAYFLDRKWGTLTPVGGEDGWWRSPRGVWRRVGPTLYDQRGAMSGTQVNRFMLPTMMRFGTQAQSTLALSSAYTYNTAGAAVASRLWRPAAGTITDLYLFIVSYTGTAGNVNDLDWSVRNDSGTTKPGSTLGASGTVNPSSATGWIRASSVAFAASAATTYWAIWADADGNGTDFATVLTVLAGWDTALVHSDKHGATTANGFNTGASFLSAPSAVVSVWADGAVMGNPFSTVAASTNNTNSKGLFITDRLAGPVRLFGAMPRINSGQAGFSSLDVWSGTTGPSGTPYSRTTTSTATPALNPSLAVLATPVMLFAGTPYRIVFKVTSNNAVPNKMNIGTGADANLKAAMPGGGTWYWTESSGTTDWSNDDTAAYPQMDVILEDLFGYPYITVGMTGGMRG